MLPTQRGSPSGELAFLGLGSNQGDRLASLRCAVACLERASGVRVQKLSSIYRSAAQGAWPQAEFLNQVVAIRTWLGPRCLLDLTQSIERRCGRGAAPSGAPRRIDVDILLLGGVIVRRPELSIPHARLSERAFVLVPLSELAPGLRHPVLGDSVAELARRLGSSQPLGRLASRDAWRRAAGAA